MATKEQAAGLENAAIAMLIADHRKVQKLFDEFESLKDENDERKPRIIEEACLALTAHAQLEEELFYPAVHEEIKEPDLVDEAEVEHDVAKRLIAQLQEGALDDAKRDATFTVLGEYINHHIEEEENEMFKQIDAAKLDTSVLAEQMRDRKLDIESELGIDESAADEQDDFEMSPPSPRDKNSAALRRDMH